MARQPDKTSRPFEWEWERFKVWEYVATVGFAGGAIASSFIPVGDGRWDKKNAFDDGIRSAIGASTESGRSTAGTASDVLLYASAGYLLFDSVVVGWTYRGSSDVAYQMSLIDLETLSFTFAVTSVVKSTTARERPFGEDCENGSALADTATCQGNNRYKSFFSGHTSTTFAAAGLTCMHHTHLPLYGGGVPDGLACAGSFAAASAVGALRVIADDHYASDVLVGAAVGTAAGLGIPYLFHYGRHRPEIKTAADARPASAASSVSWRVVPGPTGGAILGEF